MKKTFSPGPTIAVHKLARDLDRLRDQLAAVLPAELVVVGEIRRLIDEAGELARVAARYQEAVPASVN